MDKRSPLDFKPGVSQDSLSRCNKTVSFDQQQQLPATADSALTSVVTCLVIIPYGLLYNMDACQHFNVLLVSPSSPSPPLQPPEEWPRSLASDDLRGQSHR